MSRQFYGDQFIRSLKTRSANWTLEGGEEIMPSNVRKIKRYCCLTLEKTPPQGSYVPLGKGVTINANPNYGSIT